MDIRYLLASERKKVVEFWHESWAFLPFTKSFSEGLDEALIYLNRTIFLDTGIAKPRAGKRVIGLFDGGKLAAVMIIEKKSDVLEVSNAMITKSANISWRDFLGYVEQIGKLKFAKSVYLRLLQEISPDHKERFNDDGWNQDGDNYHKELTYHYGAAFGGGGARGSYGVGVWKAVDEMGMDFKVVSGTSIGASTGGMVVAGSVENAVKMWEEIETSQVIEFRDLETNTDQRMRDMIAQIGAMAISSVQNIGISSEPIRTLIEKYFDFDKMAASDKKYIVVVTETPTMVEKDIEIVKMPRNEWVDWMVASGSFFPVMQATKIRDTYYIDGGYRNNLPIDQVLINGANTVLAVDVKGPGMKKSYPNQADTSIWEVSTPWNLGTVLIFDSNRSSLNVKLGYIETKRYFGLTEGYWYTFNDSDIDLKMRNLWNAFNQYLKTNYNQEILPDSRFEEGFFAKLSAEHKAPIYRENAPLAMLEALARYANMMPIREFEVDDFISLVNEQMEQIQLEIGDALISISEWFLIYYKQFFILSNTSQFSRVRSLLEVEEEEKVRRVQFLWNKLPLPLMLVLFFDFLSDYDVQ